MLSKLFPFLDLKNAEPNLPAKLRRLADDLDQLMHFSGSPGELRNAPVIDDWAVMVTPLGVQLMGFVTGHPRFGNRPVVTSPLWAADPDGRWVRTTSRYYRLGAPGDAIHDVISAVFDACRDGGSSEDK
ncbi:hypothetical protein NP284_35945 [Rhodopseudomonas pseudopalustris]|uniref:DUF6634 family protein n=1 Tax=Rhodopseudomonas pseudopalustris TaxID=1513892 RepID=UPI003F9829DF